MTQRVKAAFLAAAVATAACVSAGAETPEEEILRAIAQLGAEKYEDRGKAEALLAEIGPEAALLYRPDDQGKDPEIRSRMSVLLEKWEFRSIDALRASPRNTRLLPWENIGYVPRHWWGYLDDDRLAPWLADRAGDDSQACVFCLTCERLALAPSVLEKGLSRDPRGLVRALASRSTIPFPEQTLEKLREIARADAAGPGADAPGLFLWRLGEREPLLKAVREKRVLGDPVLDALRGDREFCEAIGEAYADGSGPSSVPARFPSVRFVDIYVRASNADALGVLPRDAAEPALRKLLEGDAVARFRAAAYLNAMGADAPGLEAFDDPAVRAPDERGWAPEALVAAAKRIPGERVEVRLRRLVEDLAPSNRDRALALRVLAAREREQDITFIYSHLKELSPERQAEVAVALAGRGNASGVGVLLPALTGVDFRARRAAADALKTITGQDFGYDPAGTLPARCRAARRWALWWAGNKATFSPERPK
ncbi:MAG: hypothetical protein HYY18_18325 [Planctomycetes bacterium]|nr:hypothetical protein [Planctomycetota bacterium]